MHTRVCRIHAARDIRVETDPLPEPGPAQVIVAMAAAGICGSDLHYYHDGGFGPIRVREPMILGHEGAGVVAALGPGVTGLAVGDRVAVNPSRP
ncbi:MAG TPA: L-idonate 5-dehydrogenase, partial [Ruegeria sp.]|nr:L-idonate 5-dehydrogenase [Ruegeria sp.]